MLPRDFIQPDKRLSLTPFWFWNDKLEIPRLLDQLAQFQERGIHGVVIHPRIGLHKDFAWMSDNLLACMRAVIEEAARRGMHVILYDEAMYPSGSSGGQVVAENPLYACRGLVMQEEAPTSAGHHLVYQAQHNNGESIYIVDRPIESGIRGVHFLEGHGDVAVPGETWWDRRAPEEHPAATDLLNPEAVTCFIRLVYQRYFDEFGEHFGKTIPAIFTDEPYVMGRFSPYKPRPGTTGILEHVNAYLGYDFTPHLPALWFDDEPEAERYRSDYQRAIYHRLETTYYRQLSEWCTDHGVALTGHPEHPDDIGHLRYFQWPGQDVIMNDILPGEKAVTGRPSLQAKCAASAAIHQGRARNLNEFMGAYGEDVSLDLYRFVAHWLLVRGCNLLVPHAFFYSTRGARIDDCPPQLGPHGPWWNDTALTDFHRACHRLCWVNFESEPVCEVAVIGRSDRLPESVARFLFEHQIDFHYVEDRQVLEESTITADELHLGSMGYRLILAEPDYITPELEAALEPLTQTKRFVVYDGTPNCQERITAIAEPTVTTNEPCPWLRARLVRKSGLLWCLLFNEGETDIHAEVCLPGGADWSKIDVVGANVKPISVCDDFIKISLKPGEIGLFCASPARKQQQ